LTIQFRVKVRDIRLERSRTIDGVEVINRIPLNGVNVYFSHTISLNRKRVEDVEKFLAQFYNSYRSQETFVKIENGMTDIIYRGLSDGSIVMGKRNMWTVCSADPLFAEL
jgi:hypothetical protein